VEKIEMKNVLLKILSLSLLMTCNNEKETTLNPNKENHSILTQFVSFPKSATLVFHISIGIFSVLNCLMNHLVFADYKC